MLLKSPKTKSTRLQLPLGVASTSGAEPASAEVGTLSFDPDRDKVRVQTSTGWQDVGGGTDQAYIRKPASPTVAEAAFNDEFDSGSADLATRGWGLYNFTDFTAITRVGPVSLLNPALNPNTYRSTIYGSQLFLQIGAGVGGTPDVALYRAVTIPSGSPATPLLGANIIARVSGSHHSANATASGICAVALWHSLAGLPDILNRHQVSHWVERSGAPQQTGRWQVIRQRAGVYTELITQTDKATEILGIQGAGLDAGGNSLASGFVVGGSCGELFTSPCPTDPFGVNLDASLSAFGGCAFFMNPGSDQARLFVIDYIRIKLGDTTDPANWPA